MSDCNRDRPIAGSGGTPAVITEATLREKVREAIRAGTLPRRRPDRTWGGPGVGARCRICSTLVRQDEVELELEFHRSGSPTVSEKYHVHVRCFAAWELECQNLKVPGAENSSRDDTARGFRPPGEPPQAGAVNSGSLPVRGDAGNIPSRERERGRPA
jgi:hypothetical protein